MTAAPGPAGRWRRLGLRPQLMLIGIAGLAVSLALGAVVLVVALHYSLQRSLDAGGRQAGREVVDLVAQDRLPDPIPVAGTQSIQVLDGQGRVLATSVGVDHLVPMAAGRDLARLRAGQVLVLPGDRLGIDGPVRVLAVTAASTASRSTVLVASPAADIDRTVRVVRRVLAVAFPVLLALLAALAWRVIGLTLRPVEELRRSAEEITGNGREGRLPVPPSRDEIHRLALTLNSMLDRLEAARERQRAFVADAAHELRNPLASMLTQLEVAQLSRLRNGADRPAGEPDVWDEAAPDLIAETQRLARLVDDLLLLARSDAGALRVRLRPLTGAALAEEVGAVLARRTGTRVPVELDALPAEAGPGDGVPGGGDPAQAEVPVDPDALRRILDNLLDNAIRHAATRVRVGAGLIGDGDGTGSRFRIVVRDDGPGLGPEQRHQALDRFTRFDPARAREDGGTGLGLAIVAELVHLHHGTLALDDEDPGLRVTLDLPAGPAVTTG